MNLIVKLNWSDDWQWNWSEMRQWCDNVTEVYWYLTELQDMNCMWECYLFESNVSDIDFKVIMIACIWYWIIKHVLWLPSAYVCVYVCICEVSFSWVCGSSLAIFFQGYSNLLTGLMDTVHCLSVEAPAPRSLHDIFA